MHLVVTLGYIPNFGRTPQNANVQQMKTPRPILMPVFVCSSGAIFAASCTQQQRCREGSGACSPRKEPQLLSSLGTDMINMIPHTPIRGRVLVIACSLTHLGLYNSQSAFIAKHSTHVTWSTGSCFAQTSQCPICWALANINLVG